MRLSVLMRLNVKSVIRYCGHPQLKNKYVILKSLCLEEHEQSKCER